uniref:Uncharacterized protein n=1 Tax=Arundo donax TaxID=35708 RepID=A0A0A8YVB3_ARUDO
MFIYFDDLCVINLVKSFGGFNCCCFCLCYQLPHDIDWITVSF